MPDKDPFDHVVANDGGIWPGWKVAIVGPCAIFPDRGVVVQDACSNVAILSKDRVKPLPQPVKVQIWVGHQSLLDYIDGTATLMDAELTPNPSPNDLLHIGELTITPEQIEAARKAVAK